MTYVFVGAVGFFLGLAAHDVALQSLSDTTSLRPMAGTCVACGSAQGWTRLRCVRCGVSMARGPVVAIVTAAAAVGFLHTVGFEPVLVPYLVFLTLTSALVVTDLEAFRIVDRLNLAGTAVVTVLLVGAVAVTGTWSELLRALGGATAYFTGAALLFIVVRGRGFGAGDVKLAPQLGLFTAYLGWGVLGWAVFATAMIGGFVALVLVMTGAAGRKTELPYGPPMILGAWSVIVLVGVGAIPIPS
ncbi:MAG TPA: A24 family peptidase [Acidimicrobiia bacterium]|nr:A24 family peptidase [Acidimicrobiia bacterium]